MIGDILVALNGKPVKDTDDVQSVLEPGFVGKAVKASLVRGGALTEASDHHRRAAAEGGLT